MRDERRHDIQTVLRSRALGTAVELLVTDPTVLVAAAELLEVELQRIDRVASRFRSDSELCRLNEAGSAGMEVSDDLLEAVEVAVAMADATGGLVDPTVGPAMIRLGYDRDFAELAQGIDRPSPGRHPVAGWQRVSIDPRTSTVLLPPDSTLDLGATAKALAADRAASLISRRLGCGALVSLGGDVAVAGAPPVGGFVIGIADTCTSTSASCAVAISSGGLATSGVGVRQWRLGDELVHHIVDPSTGLPASPFWRTVTVTAATCVQANAASTAAIVLGEEALSWLQERRLPARLVHVDGTVAHTDTWPQDPGGPQALPTAS